MFTWMVAGFLVNGATGMAASTDLVPLSTSDGICIQTTAGGRTIWQNSGDSNFLYFRRPNTFPFTVGQTLYVRATYLDEGSGKLGMNYDGQAGAFTEPVVHTRTSRVGSGEFVEGYFELQAVHFARRENGSTDFRLVCGRPGGIPFSVSKITLQDTPFADANFQLAVSRPWKTRYIGPSRDDVDTTTLKDKVMVGYQGWFRTPNDLDDNGWFHWCGNNRMSPPDFNTDMWPDLTEYDPATLVRAGNVMTRGGQPAHVFSSTSLPAVQKHFRWMRKHNIDGAFIQRFGPQAGKQPEWVLRNISQAAAEEGITWAIEYDVSGMADSTVAAKLQADWEWLTTEFGLLDDPRYSHEGSKPVVFIWGLPFADRGFTTPNANAAVEYFKNQGAYVIGGIPNTWKNLAADWQAHLLQYDGILVWQNQGTSDGATFRNRGQDFFPHIWPGFSWANLTKTPASPPTAYTDRNAGQYYWSMGRNWIQSGGADRLFVGMFDEYDEGTAIMPMSDDPPAPPSEYGRFIDNQGKPSDWWMVLTDELKRMMLKQRANTNNQPTTASLTNRSNIGSEAMLLLGNPDTTDSLALVQSADGSTIAEMIGDRECRSNAVPAVDQYMYFDADDSFAHQMTNGDVTVEVEYFDADTSTVMGLQYDGPTAYKIHPQTLTTTGSNRWRRVRFEIADAYFGGRQNGAADFRLTTGGKKLSIARVWVRLPEVSFYPFSWVNPTTVESLSWTEGGNWLGGSIAPSSPLSTIRFFPEQTLSDGIVTIVNEPGGRQAGSILLGGKAGATAPARIKIQGQLLTLAGTSPKISIDAMNGAGSLRYEIASAMAFPSMTEVTGNGDGGLEISGGLSGTGGIRKTGDSLLRLTGAAGYTGATSVAGGMLEVDGTLAGSSLRIEQSAVLSGSGTISASTEVFGTHQPRGQSFQGTLDYAATAVLKWSLAENTSPNHGLDAEGIRGNTVTVRPGAVVDIKLDSPGSTVDFTNPWWAATREWPFISTTGNLSGKFLLGTITPDAFGNAPTAHGAFSLIHAEGEIRILWSPARTYEKWRVARFGVSPAEPEFTRREADPDGDGISNLMEYALGLDPRNADTDLLPRGEITGDHLAFLFSHPIGHNDLVYRVEWSTDLSDWSVDEVEEETISEENGLRSVRALIPHSTSQRFIRLKVVSP